MIHTTQNLWIHVPVTIFLYVLLVLLMVISVPQPVQAPEILDQIELFDDLKKSLLNVSNKAQTPGMVQVEWLQKNTIQHAYSDPLSFGSQEVLQRLWSIHELEGKPADKKIYPLRPPDLRPPEDPIFKAPALEPLTLLLRNSIRWVKPSNDKKFVALTFDLCERVNEVTGYDATLVNALRKDRVKATFFAGGKWMRSHPEKTMQLMADPLFEIGNHAWTHGNLAVLDSNAMWQQIQQAQTQYELLWEKLYDRAVKANIDPAEIDKIPRLPRLFRPPYGRCRPEALDMLAQLGLPSIQWDVVSADPVRSQTPAKLIKTVISQVRPGSIVVFHGNGRGYGTAEAVPVIVERLREQGYEFVTVSELLKSGQVVATDDCFETKPNDNKHYDQIFGKGTGE